MTNNQTLEGVWASVLEIWSDPGIQLGSRWKLEYARNMLIYHSGVAVGIAIETNDSEKRRYGFAVYDLASKLRDDISEMILEGIRHDTDKQARVA